MTMKKPKVSVAIPTYESSESLIKTVDSIHAQTASARVSEILIVVDGKKMSLKIKGRLLHPKVRIVQRSKQLGQSKRLQDIFALSSSELLIVTNDDVLLHKNAVANFITAYQKTNADFFSASVTPFEGQTFLRHILAVSYDINKTLISLLKNKTYLSANGRLIALSKSFYKTIVVPQRLQNNDAYLYFYAKMHRFSHVHVKSAIAFFHSPLTVAEHLKQSGKFQRSFAENQMYFTEDLRKYYKVPLKIAFYALLLVLMRKPVLTTCYVGILALSRIASEKRVLPESGVWETDLTTKEG